MKFKFTSLLVSRISVRVLAILLLLTANASCIKVEPFLFDVSDVTTSRDFQRLDSEVSPIDVTNVFSTRDPQIAICYRLKTTTQLSITYRWYREQSLILSRSIMATRAGRYCTTIIPQGDQGFHTGEYSVEILLRDMVLKRTTFTIE